jgi:hypothetical protein
MRRMIGILAVAALALAGCAGELGVPALPAGVTVNARVMAGSGGGDWQSADTVARGRCVSCEEYGKRRRGEWETKWYVVTCEVTEVEKGNWKTGNRGGRLVFVATDAWPVPGSGIMADKAPWPYQAGKKVQLWTKTGGEMVEIVQAAWVP